MDRRLWVLLCLPLIPLLTVLSIATAASRTPGAPPAATVSPAAARPAASGAGAAQAPHASGAQPSTPAAASSTWGAAAPANQGHAGRTAPAAASLERAFSLLEARGVLPAGTAVPRGGRPVSRGELARWLVRALARPVPAEAGLADALALAAGFGWVPETWGAQAAASSQPVSRAELAAIAHAVLGPATGRWPADRPVPGDLLAVPEPARTAALAALANGLLALDPGGRFQGDRAAEVGEAAAWLVRLMELRGVLFDDAGVLVARDPAGGTLVVEIAGRDTVVRVDGSTVLYRNGEPVTLAALRPGDELRLIWGTGDPRVRPAASPLARLIDATFSGAEGVVAGVSWTAGRITVRGPDGLARAYAVERGAPVFLNGRPTTLASLQAGDRVYLVLRAASGAVRMLDATRFGVTGRLLRVDPVHGYLYVVAAGTTTQLVAGETLEVVRGGRRVSLADLRAGDEVSVATERPGVALYVEVRDPAVPREEAWP